MDWSDYAIARRIAFPAFGKSELRSRRCGISSTLATCSLKIVPRGR